MRFPAEHAIVPVLVPRMEPIVWTDEFSVGVAQLDAQHQRLVKMINQLSAAGETSTGSEAVSDSLTEMTQYAQTHFAVEEQMLRDNGYPDLERHMAEHLAFQERTSEFLTATMLSVTHVPESLLLYLRGWLVNHILTSDMAYKSFFRNLGLD